MATDDSSKRTPLNSLGKPEIRNTRTRLGQESIPRLETHNQSSKESNPASTRSQNTTHKKHQHISLQKRKSPSRPSITSPTTHTATSQLARSTHSIERKPSPNNKLINPQTKTGKTGKSSSRLVPENDGNTRPSKRGNTTSLKKAPRSKSGKAISSESRGGLPLPPAVRIANDGSTARLLSPAAAVAAAAKNRAAESARAKPQPRSRFDSMQPGRQFTVGNIGANGLITLRPMVRSAQEIQRQRQPLYPFSDVIPPPEQDLPPPPMRRRNSSFGAESVFSSAFSQSQYRRPSVERTTNSGATSRKASGHFRSHSFSTLDERSSRAALSRQGTRRVAVRPTSRRGLGRRASFDTSADFVPDVPDLPDVPPLPLISSADSKAPSAIPSSELGPLNNVSNPSFRLGKPHFGSRGSTLLRVSRSTDPRSSQSKSRDGLSVDPAPSRLASSFMSGALGVLPLGSPNESNEILVPRAPVLSTSSPRGSISHFAMNIFEKLADDPDDLAVVRFNAADEIIAATPSRLIAHITSPSFLDYELLSDFFLTFRAFLLPSDLVSFLVARLRWAVERIDDFGRIVRVRTFVALRHWILNYYSDDFAPDFALRVHFCDLVNGLFQDLQRRSDGGGGDLKIIGELKKCWRRTCGVYWPAEKAVSAMDEEIYPGGRYESIYWEEEDAEVGQAMPMERVGGQVVEIKQSDKQTAEKAIGHRHQQSKDSAHQSTRNQGPQLSPTSTQSLHVISCSIPFKPMFRHDQGTARPFFPHPVLRPLTPVSNASIPGKGSKRGGTSAEASREPLSAEMRSGKPEPEIEIDAVAPGSLVHGALYPPISPYFEMKTTTISKATNSTLITPHFRFDSETSLADKKDTAEGMKKLLGNMRRAFTNNRGLMSPLGVPHSPALYSNDQDSLSTLKISSSQLRGNRPISTAQIRIDILTSTAAEAFRIAVAMEQSGEVKETHLGTSPKYNDHRKYSSAFEGHDNPVYHGGRSVTVGSRSIVIMDDTNSEPPLMSGALSPGEDFKPHASYADTSDLMTSNGREEDLRRGSSSIPDPTSIRHASWTTPEVTTRNNPAPVVYVPGMAKAAATAGVYMPTGYRQAESGHLQERGLRGSRGNFRNSMHSNAPSSSNHKYASYHSGTTNSVALDGQSRRSASRGRSNSKASESNDKFGSRQLKRKAGGNLKELNKAYDVDARAPRRHSVDSYSTKSRSRQGSLMYQSSRAGSHRVPLSPVHGRDEDSNDIEETSVVSATPQNRRGRSISLIQTHSSQPILRPSFEAEVAKLKALPDDGEDGGIESTLLKLEGRYEKKSPTTSNPVSSDDEAETDKVADQQYLKHHEHVEDIHVEQTLSMFSMGDRDGRAQTRSILRLSGSPAASRITSYQDSTKESLEQLELSATGHFPQNDTRASQTSSKLLSKKSLGGESAYSTRVPPGDGGSKRVDSAANPLDEYEEEAKDATAPLDAGLARQKSMASTKHHASKKNSARKMKRNKKNNIYSVDAATSFLFDVGSDDSDDDINEHESESFFNDIADDEDDENGDDEESSEKSESDEDQGDESSLFGRASQPPETPTQRLVPPVEAIPQRTPPSQLRDGEVALSTSPVIPTSQEPSATKPRVAVNVPKQITRDDKDISPTIRNSIMHPPHLPFILAYEADHLAQQLTILERDALEELDWRELIDMKWNQSPVAASDWVVYLRTPDPFGVGLVIARFNLMVKWVISELILTDSPQERARIIVHYIRIAAHSRTLRNFATMYQITVALLSTDCSRLKRTWSFVPNTEISILQDLERLVQPVRNFHNLRVEMETAPTDAGCIPFIGIYTRDLVYNAQKPAIITSDPQNSFEPLVNFERYSTAAGIVKSLLRLLEQSTKYNFTPDPPCLARCLWVAALDESEIRIRGDRLD